LKGLTQRVHRVAYAMGHGIPEGLHVLHKCDNKLCVRPSHLFLGTNADNMADRDTKGRQAKGASSGSAKLTETQVKAIRRDTRTQRVIGKDYGVSHALIGYIKRNEAWTHVK
jgi:hypothetical protein